MVDLDEVEAEVRGITGTVLIILHGLPRDDVEAKRVINDLHRELTVRMGQDTPYVLGLKEGQRLDSMLPSQALNVLGRIAIRIDPGDAPASFQDTLDELDRILEEANTEDPAGVEVPGDDVVA